MKFTKMHGIGNDYVYINAGEYPIHAPHELAVRVSDRHCGIGSDGLILITPSSVADVGMRMFNSDGSESAMCGNGIRCVGKYAYDNGLVSATRLTVETAAGIKTLELEVQTGRVCRVRVDMGEPELRPSLIPLSGHDEEPSFIDRRIDVNGDPWRITSLSMGNPHAVTFLDPETQPGLDELNLERLGPLFEHHPLFPQRVNTEFVECVSRSELRMRVWERGAGETMACGTGACAVAVAGVLNNVCDRQVTVHLLRGSLDIIWDRTDNRVFMTGEAVTVFTGDLYL